MEYISCPFCYGGILLTRSSWICMSSNNFNWRWCDRSYNLSYSYDFMRWTFLFLFESVHSISSMTFNCRWCVRLREFFLEICNRHTSLSFLRGGRLIYRTIFLKHISLFHQHLNFYLLLSFNFSLLF